MTHSLRYAYSLGAAMAVATLAPAVAAADTPVSVNNPLFTIPMPGVPAGTPAHTAATCGLYAVGSSASKDWTTYANNAFGSITSWLTTAPDGTPANLTTVGGAQNGLVQVMVGQGTRTTVNRVTAVVYVLAGQVVLEMGDGGSGGGATPTSTTTGAWEVVSGCGRADMLNNEIVLYGTGPAVFYVRKVTVEFDQHCPSLPPPK